MARIVYHRQKCIGCGICFELQPDLWRMSKKDGKATLVWSISKKTWFVLFAVGAMLQKAGEVAAACPGKAIKIG